MTNQPETTPAAKLPNERCLTCGYEERNLAEIRDNPRVDDMESDYSLPCPNCGGKMWPNGKAPAAKEEETERCAR